MRGHARLLMAGGAVLALTACDMAGTGREASSSAAEQTCLEAVAAETNNEQVAVLSSAPTDAGTDIRIGVGPNRAPWQCVAYRNGSTGQIMFLGDEGFL